MTYVKISAITDELTDRGYHVKDEHVASRVGHKFLEFVTDTESFCVGPFEGVDDEGDIIVDTSNLWACRLTDLQNNVFKNDKALPDTDDPYIIVNSLEAWVMRDCLFPHAIPV